MEYITPRVIYISNTDKETAKLYELEDKRNNAIEAAARQWMQLMEIKPDEYWTRALPQQLFDTLESNDQQAAIRAAVAFLALHGYGPVEVNEIIDTDGRGI